MSYCRAIITHEIYAVNRFFIFPSIRKVKTLMLLYMVNYPFY
nr:MAG TPA: hypothetical protein [Caudoviricetes sp.]